MIQAYLEQFLICFYVSELFCVSLYNELLMRQSTNLIYCTVILCNMFQFHYICETLTQLKCTSKNYPPQIITYLNSLKWICKRIISAIITIFNKEHGVKILLIPRKFHSNLSMFMGFRARTDIQTNRSHKPFSRLLERVKK